MKSFALIAALAGAASALQITSPTENDKWDLSATNTIKWSSVDSDPAFFKLVLINHPPSTAETSTTIAENVTTSKGQYDLTNFAAAPGDKYSIKAYGILNANNGQLAESKQFNVTKSGTASTTTTDAPSSSGTGTGTTAASSPSKSSEAFALGKSFGVAGPLAVVFAMLF
ncbi:Ser-Thr-rich glycosyl-phosphatidyl-inositol-anchored membrane family-domain-containing protein [Lasiosphaeria miniovina]|uniref:Ser-Thr-rich glycosyl-phosphatidyl-inositol-anchored membrane family-domain-containing protein n=1 Tax=Lasiosphaeria miniovina TaxID=1954250 RepID=A0AA40ATA5_9PEZI|nr:Ser-Thr-rich glycosyl-phosphatidyl-inositol-anchored membrane family-domain-containing protein [Lasiosphaeria miniovina]KAK0721615.1 Ser-Thr-rich glycosyl-phosphatidyl-inositol-anchored membrane family-domain-containing protein [Lasiosphaeria miniovina]